MTSESAAAPAATSNRDWRIWFGLISSLFWLCLAIMYIGMVVGFGNFVTQPADVLGGFLEGAFAPLAFLWLVIGYFLQQRELRHSNLAIRAQSEEMRRTAENAEIQSRAIEANELHQRQETFLLVAEQVHRQLGAVFGLLFMSSQAPGQEPGSTSTAEEISDLWSRLGAGDPEGFARQFLSLYFRGRADPRYVYDLFFGTPIRTRHSETILHTFGRLLRSARGCDPDSIITDSLLGSAHGMVYRIIEEQRENPPG